MKNKRGWIWFLCGGLMMLTAAGLAGYNLWEGMRAANATYTAAAALREKLAEQAAPAPLTTPAGESPDDASARLPQESPAPPRQEPPAPTAEIPDHLRDPSMEMPTTEISGQNYVGIVDIPALGLNLPIINEWSYPRLKLAPCRYSGSAYLNNLIILAHNYQSHFGTLHNLKIGDSVYFTDMNENVFAYEVVEVETLGSADVERMTAGDWDLTLFTCTVGGKTRVTVRCQRTE